MFDIGCQQHGNYVGVEQPDEKNEEEEAAPTLVPKWKAGEITESKLEPDEEDLVGDGAGDAPAGEDIAAAEGESFNHDNSIVTYWIYECMINTWYHYIMYI